MVISDHYPNSKVAQRISTKIRFVGRGGTLALFSDMAMYISSSP